MERKKNLGFPRSRSSLCWPRPPLSFGRSRVSIPLGRLVLTTPTSICLALQTSRSIMALFLSRSPLPPRPPGLADYRCNEISRGLRMRCVAHTMLTPSLPPLCSLSPIVEVRYGYTGRFFQYACVSGLCFYARACACTCV